jgi:hypothetical protein
MNPLEIKQGRETEILQRIANEAQEVLLLNAPVRWSERRLDLIEGIVLDQTRHIIDGMPINLLRSEGVFAILVAQAISHTKRLIQDGLRNRLQRRPESA